MFPGFTSAMYIPNDSNAEMIRSTAGSDQWVSAILDPNKILEPKYRQSTILTEDGEVVSGLVLERNDRELVIGVSDGSVKTVPAASIADEKSAGTSLMPVGFEQKLTPQQLSELLGFLRSR